jgi:O-antigen/teichoic acid export membrane protein
VTSGFSNGLLAWVREWRSRSAEAFATMITGGIARGLTLVTILLLAPRLIKSLGDARFGIYVSLVGAIALLGGVDLGYGAATQNRLIRAVETRDEQSRRDTYAYLVRRTAVVTLILVLIVALSGLTGLGAAIIGNVADIPRAEINIAIILFGGSFIVTWMISILRSPFAAERKTYINNIYSATVNACFLASIFLFCDSISTLARLGAVYLLATTLGAAAYLAIFAMSIGPKYVIRTALRRPLNAAVKLGRESVGFAIVQILGICLYQLDVLFVTRFLSPESTTTYYLLQRWTTVFVVFWGLLLPVMWTAFARMWSRKAFADFKTAQRRFLSIAIVLAVTNFVLWALIGPTVLRLLTGRTVEFALSSVLLAASFSSMRICVDSIATLCNSIGATGAQALTATAQCIVSFTVAASLAGSLGINAVLLGQVAGLVFSPLLYLPFAVRRTLGEAEKTENVGSSGANHETIANCC